MEIQFKSIVSPLRMSRSPSCDMGLYLTLSRSPVQWVCSLCCLMHGTLQVRHRQPGHVYFAGLEHCWHSSGLKQ